MFVSQALVAILLVILYETDVLAFLSRKLHVSRLLPSLCEALDQYAWMYFMLFTMLACTLYRMYVDVLLDTQWLDTSRTKALVISRYEGSSEADKWNAEASMDDYYYLIWFSLSSPLWTVCTCFVCVMNARRHWKAPTSSDARLRSWTIFIIGLPLAYGLMSLRTVYRCWQMCIASVKGGDSHLFDSFERGQEFLEEVKDVNLKVGDAYEAYALSMFGRLVFAAIQKARQLSPEVRRTARASQEERLQKPWETMQQVVLGGFKWFYGVIFFQTVWMALVLMARTYCATTFHSETPKRINNNCNTKSMEGNADWFFSGAGLIASGIAISNMMQVESTFHKELDVFKPFWKFWSTKILLSVAFAQDLGFAFLLSGWTNTRRDLLQASFLTVECFVLSLLHVITWTADQQWYYTREAVGLELAEREACA